MPLYEEYDQLRKDSRETRIFGMALLSVGLVFIALVQFVQTGLYLVFSEPAVAKVTSVKLEKVYGGRGGPSTVYRPMLRFQSPTGMPYHVSSSETYGRRPAVGEELPIRYDPGNPSELRGASFWQLWGVPLLCAGLGSFGVVFFLAWRKRQVQAAADAQR
jgi:hypothetical protein